MPNKAIQLRQIYFEQEYQDFPIEVILFWEKVLLLQEASKKDMETFCKAQKEFFNKKKIDPYSKFAITNLITDRALTRARCYGMSEDIDSTIDRIPNMEAYKAKNTYISYKSDYYPSDKSSITGNLYVWKKVIHNSNKANVHIEDYIRAQFIWCKNKNFRIPYPSVLASEEGIKRSLTINKTIL